MFSNKNKKQKAASAAKKANFNFSTQGGKTSQSARLKTSTIVIVLLVAVISSALITGSTMYHFMTENKTAINNGKTRSVSYTKYDNGNISDDSNANWREEIKPETVHEYPELFKKGMKRKKYDNNIIKKGEIKWQQPEDIGDLGFTSKKMYEGCFGECDIKGFTSGGIKYYKVGKIIEGEFKDRDIVVIKSSIHGGGPGGTGIDITRALVTGEDVIFMVDEKDGWTVNQLNEIFIQGEINKVMADVSIEELTYPKKLKWNDEKGGAITFARNKYDKAFFTSDKLRLAFTHPSYRQIFTTDTNLSRDSKPTKFKLNHRLGYNHKTKIIEEVYIDIFNKNGFYIKAPDGTAVSYKMNFSIFDKPETTHGVLQAVWSDGEKNTIKYGLNCGEYVCDKTAEIKKSNLEIVGKMDQGGKIYTYKDTTHPDLQKMHKDEYWVKGDEPKKNIHDFLKMRPQIFWEDPFGRLLVFTRQDIVSPAEMGKPVIYLYPEEEMEVNVQVKPVGGISISESEYNAGGINGWQVTADTKSNLKNKANGKTYPYLFWEGYSDDDYEIPQKGFVIANEEIDKFLNEKLTQLGMIQKEVNDFKEFWVPEMRKINKPYYFVTFLPTEKIDEMAPLFIEPNPDSVIRVLMDYKGLEEYQNIEELKITTPERNGFVAVEWGGIL